MRKFWLSKGNGSWKTLGDEDEKGKFGDKYVCVCKFLDPEPF